MLQSLPQLFSYIFLYLDLLKIRLSLAENLIYLLSRSENNTTDTLPSDLVYPGVGSSTSANRYRRLHTHSRTGSVPEIKSKINFFF